MLIDDIGVKMKLDGGMFVEILLIRHGHPKPNYWMFMRGGLIFP